MKNSFISIICLIAIPSILLSQDIIYLKSDTTSIRAKILEVNPTNVTYKKFSYLEGPKYTIDKKAIDKIVYKNGDVETYTNYVSYSNIENIERQAELELIPGSRLFLTFDYNEKKRNVNGEDAKEMLKSYLLGKTRCLIVSTVDEADFIIELSVIKKGMGDRSAKIVITNIFNDKVVYKSKWARGSSSAWAGYSGSRAAIGKVVKKQLLKQYPQIKL